MQVRFLHKDATEMNISDFLKDISTPYDHQQQQPPSSNPWNMPPTSNSISPPNSGLTTGGSLL